MLSKKETALQKEQEVKKILQDVQDLKYHSMGRVTGFFSKNAEILSGLAMLLAFGATIYFSLRSS